MKITYVQSQVLFTEPGVTFVFVRGISRYTLGVELSSVNVFTSTFLYGKLTVLSSFSFFHGHLGTL